MAGRFFIFPICARGAKERDIAIEWQITAKHLRLICLQKYLIIDIANLAVSF